MSDPERRRLEAALARAPTNPGALNALGVHCLGAGDPARAAELFTQATAIDPNAGTLWMNLANAQRALGEDAGERASLERVLALDARELGALIRKAQLQQRLGETMAATRTWGAAIAVAPPPAERGGPIAQILADAQAYVAEHSRAFTAAIDGDLSAARAAHAPAELRRFDTAVDVMLGRRRIYMNECAGLHFPFLPAHEFFDCHHFTPWLADLEAATPAIQSEIASLLTADEGFAPYIQMPPGLPANLWSELDQSPRWSAYHLWTFGEPRPEALARCPATRAVLEAIPRAELPGRCPNAFFSILKPRTRIPPHGGVSNTRLTVHLPLIVPEGCGFRVGGETREWRVGEAFVFDDTIEHEAWNDSDHVRAVLIFDVWNPYLTAAERELLKSLYVATDASGRDPKSR